jgi:hypothetical protein
LESIFGIEIKTFQELDFKFWFWALMMCEKLKPRFVGKKDFLRKEKK